MKIAVLFCFLASSGLSYAKIIEQVKVVVDEQMILKSELSEFEKKIKSENLVNQNLMSLFGLSSNPTQEDILNYLILKKVLVLKSSKEKGGVALDNLADREIQNLASQNNITQDQLRKEIESRGINFNDYKTFIGESSLIRDTIERNVISQVRPSEEDFVSFLKRNDITDIRSSFTFDLDQIFVSKSIQNETKILNQINAQNFKTFFKNPEKYNLDALALGTLKFRDLSSQHQKFVKELDDGELSQPIEENNGFRLFFVNNKTTSYNIPNSPAVQAKQKEFYDNLIKNRFTTWTSNLKQDFFIRINK